MPTMGKSVLRSKTIGKHFVKDRMVGQKGTIHQHQDYDSVKKRGKKGKLRKRKIPL